MKRVILYVLVFFGLFLCADYFIAEKDSISEYADSMVDSKIWKNKKVTRIDDSRTIVKYDDGKHFNEITLNTQNEEVVSHSQRIRLKDKLMLVWDKNRIYKPESADFANVISPPLYAVDKNDRGFFLKALTDAKAYVKNCDKEVWGMYTNGYDADKTREFITDTHMRENIADEICKSATESGLGGVNIDFENMYKEDAPHFSEFIKILSQKLHKENIILSVDVTKINNGSSFYSMCYDRPEISKYADYVIMMGYDQYSRTSKTAGPVSAINWTYDAVSEILKEVPSAKLVLGIPFYTRMWEEKDGIVESAPAISMAESKAFKEKDHANSFFDEFTGLDYIQFPENENIYKIWVENETSVKSRLDIADEFNLSGIACWSLGYESEDVHKLLKKYVTDDS